MKLKEFRLKNDLSQCEFAKIIGVPRSTYQMWEYGIRKPSSKNKILIENAIIKIGLEKLYIAETLYRTDKTVEIVLFLIFFIVFYIFYTIL